MKNARNILISCALTAPVWFGIGRLTSEPDPQPIHIELPAAPWVGQRECVCQPPDCPVIECPVSLHEQALEAKATSGRLDAYLRGAESIWWSTELCEDAVTFGPYPACSQEVQCLWDVEYDLGMLGLRVNMESVENHNWHKACRELIRVWPTESEVEGSYPSDFPKYCW